jgi:hypothetical protein
MGEPAGVEDGAGVVVGAIVGVGEAPHGVGVGVGVTDSLASAAARTPPLRGREAEPQGFGVAVGVGVPPAWAPAVPGPPPSRIAVATIATSPRAPAGNSLPPKAATEPSPCPEGFTRLLKRSFMERASYTCSSGRSTGMLLPGVLQRRPEIGNIL